MFVQMSDTPVPPKKYHHGSLKEACLHEGLTLLKEAGVARFSLREVARRVGVSTTAIYHYFPDKKDLLGALAGVGLLEIREALETSFRGGPDLEGTFLQMGRAYLSFFQTHPYYLDLLFVPEFAGDEATVNLRNGTFSLVANLLTGAGVPEEEAGGLTLWIWSTLHGFATLAQAGVFGDSEAACPPGVNQIFKKKTEAVAEQLLPLITRSILHSIR